jgi:UDPglucose 6-dehydrogenase
VCQTNCKGCKDNKIVEKSTLPVRTAEAIKSILDNTGNGVQFQICQNQSFAEGTAVDDLLHPDRILIGGDSGGRTKKQYKRWLMCTQIGFLLIY